MIRNKAIIVTREILQILKHILDETNFSYKEYLSTLSKTTRAEWVENNLIVYLDHNKYK